MHQVLIDIISGAIIEHYQTEEQFYQEYLSLDEETWKKWKNGEEVLSGEEMHKIKALFSDYEWMLIQKILRQTLLFPEKRNHALSEYKRLKTIIAKKWVRAGEGLVELITQKTSGGNEKFPQSVHITLRVSMKYGEWGYDDILEFCLPSGIQKQIEASSVDLLEWVDQNLTDTYMNEYRTTSKEL